LSQEEECENLIVYGEQIRAARGLLGWSQADLASKADVGLMTVKRFEAKKGPVIGTITSLTRIQAALEDAGIHFIAPDEWGSFGVRLSPTGGPKKSRTVE
jgi:transcriptional regulator with XRE-family HTH domain